MLVSSSSIVAASIAGIDNKNENSAASFFETPDIRDTAIVLPDLDIPGITAKPWVIPIKMLLNRFMGFVVFCFFWTMLEVNNNKAVKSRAVPTSDRSPLCAFRDSLKASPIMPVGIIAIII